MTHPPHHAAGGGVQWYNVSTITLAKLFTTTPHTELVWGVTMGFSKREGKTEF